MAQSTSDAEFAARFFKGLGGHIRQLRERAGYSQEDMISFGYTVRYWQRVERDLRRSPREFGFAHTMWDGPLLAEHLHRRYHLKLGVRQCQRLFRQMDFRLRKPRPVIAKADPAAQAVFKKTASPVRQSKG